MFGRLRRAEQHIDQLQARIWKLEGLIAERAGVDGDELARLLVESDPGLTTEVRELAEQGQTVAAIRAYRVATGAGLKAAKDAVEAYAARLAA
ncbi:hypothetical protein HUN08_07940 [Gordonia sp. X0973]|uniref:hypothetical protein n=1 Tax=Gordonia sp. X0973 TaxID=2742602 RepID=UPI000F52F6BF|nr:hypothetical protein [Gordonia sp. X0973]QKT07137.1 hypothetical protein HUN08_07940 [Gordonia sp. X0973]